MKSNRVYHRAVKRLASTGTAVRFGVLVAVLWAGALWGWSKLAATRVSGWIDARNAKLVELGSEPRLFMTLDETQRSSLEAWERNNPVPSGPIPLWPDGLERWSVVVGAYVALVVVVQLRAEKAK
jgi:hypothetical protein